jgi:thiamine-phosphate pyrophosphorylase
MRLHALVSDPATARLAVDEGATVVQLRLKGATSRERREMAVVLRPFCPTLVVNDDVEAALASGADAVHLGQEDTGHERARAAGLRVGMSARTVDGVRAAERMGAWYIGAGPVWATPTKPSAGEPIGLGGLATLCGATTVPIIAIGGIDASNAGACIAAGAAGIAVVRAVSDARAILAAVDAPR